MLSKSHALVGGELPPLLGISLSRGSSCQCDACALAFRDAWSIHPALSWAGETLQEMCGDQDMLGDALLRGSCELFMG